MNLFSWLFGKAAPPTGKQEPTPAPVPERNTGKEQAGGHSPARPAEHAVQVPVQEPLVALESENLRRWKESGRPRAWVEQRDGRWDHASWIALLEELKQSPFWPMQPDSVGLVLEELKQDWLRRN